MAQIGTFPTRVESFDHVLSLWNNARSHEEQIGVLASLDFDGEPCFYYPATLVVPFLTNIAWQAMVQDKKAKRHERPIELLIIWKQAVMISVKYAVFYFCQAASSAREVDLGFSQGLVKILGEPFVHDRVQWDNEWKEDFKYFFTHYLKVCRFNKLPDRWFLGVIASGNTELFHEIYRIDTLSEESVVSKQLAMHLKRALVQWVMGESSGSALSGVIDDMIIHARLIEDVPSRFIRQWVMDLLYWKAVAGEFDETVLLR